MANSSKRSHSPPLPPNATYHHPTITLTILPSANRFVAGSKLTGMLEVSCKDQNKVALGQLAIEFFGVEELKLRDHSAQTSIHGPHKCLFQGPALPPSNAVATSEAPIAGHYYKALRGRTKFPFSFPLPSKLPSSATFEQLGAVRYTLKATCQVLTIKSQQNVVVTATRLINIVTRRPDWSSPALLHEPVEARAEIQGASGGGGVWAELKMDKRLHWNSLPSPNPGLIQAVLSVKNSSRRLLSGGVTVKLCRRLVVSQDSKAENPVQVVCTKTLRGPEYEIPAVPGQTKMIDLTCPLPAIIESDKASTSNEAECFTACGMTLFTIQVFLRVEIELGALSEDLVIELPIEIVHPASLPPEALCEPTPTTIDHIRSPDPLAIPHHNPSNPSRPASHTSFRSSSPHPMSLQPGGGSRCGSPQPDWPDARSGAPSPVPTACFSPLPTPRHSPLPSARFSSPFPYSSSPAYEPANSARPSLPYYPPTPVWSAPVTPYISDVPPETTYCQPHVHSPWPEPYQPPHSNSYSPYPDPGSSQPQPVASSSMNTNLFSPPATPWCRRTDTVPNLEHQTPVSSYFASPGPIPSSQPLDTSRTRRHQSLPPTPALSLQSGSSGIPPSGYSDDNTSNIRAGLEDRDPRNTPLGSDRRISMPMMSPELQMSVSVRKRALPTPPLGAPITTSQDEQYSSWSNALQSTTNVKQSQQNGDTCWNLQQSMFSDHRQSTPMGSRAQPDINWEQSSYAHEIALDQVSEGLMNALHSETLELEGVVPERNIVSQPGRLETIGEAGESRIGTMDANHVSKELLEALCDSPGMISHTRGMKPRRSEGSDSVQTLEDFVAAQDDLRQQTPDQASEAPSTSTEADGMQSNSNEDETSLPPSCDSRSSHSRDNPPPVSTNKPKVTKSPSAGLLHLAGFLNRAKSTNTMVNETLDQKPFRNVSQNLSVVPGPQPECPTTSSHTGTAGALRVKCSGISYNQAFVDAVVPPLKLAKSIPASSGEKDQAKTPTMSNWVPPPSSTPLLRSVNGDDPLKLLEDEKADDQQLPRQPAVPPAALFPTFDHRHRRQSLPDCSAVPVRPIVTTQTPLVVKKRSLKKNASQTKRMSQPPPAPVTSVPSPVNQEKLKPSATEKVARWLNEADSEEARHVKVLEDVQPRKPSKWSALGIEMADEELVSNHLKATKEPITSDQEKESVTPLKPTDEPVPRVFPSAPFPSCKVLTPEQSPQLPIISQSNIEISAPRAIRPISIQSPISFASRSPPIDKRISSVNALVESFSLKTGPTPPLPRRPLPTPQRASSIDARTVGTRPLFASTGPSSATSIKNTDPRSSKLDLIPFPTSDTTQRESIAEEAESLKSSRRHSSYIVESPTNPSIITLSRKSRTKRQISPSVIDIIRQREEEKENAEGKEMINKELLLSIEATNAAVQKATSKTLSTPTFTPSPSLNYLRTSPSKRSLCVLPNVVESFDKEEEGKIEERQDEEEGTEEESEVKLISTRSLSINDRCDNRKKQTEFIIQTNHHRMMNMNVRNSISRSSESSEASSLQSNPQKVGKITDLIKRWEIK